MYGVPAVERNGTTYLLGETSNVPNVTKGVQSLEDAQALGTAMVKTAVDGTVATLNTWSTSPEVVNNGLLSIGPALDNAVNYYSSASFDQVGRDCNQLLRAS